MPSVEREGFVENYKQFSKRTLKVAVGATVVGAIILPPLLIPSLAISVVEGAQIIAIDQYQKKKDISKKAA